MKHKNKILKIEKKGKKLNINICICIPMYICVYIYIYTQTYIYKIENKGEKGREQKGSYYLSMCTKQGVSVVP